MPLPGYCSCYFSPHSTSTWGQYYTSPINTKDQKIVNHCYRLNGNRWSWSFHTVKYLLPWYGIIMWCWKLTRHGVYWRFECYQPRRNKTPYLFSFQHHWCQPAYHNQGWTYFALGKEQVAIQPRTVIHNVWLIHKGQVKFCHQVRVLLWTKIAWALTRKWYNPNQTLSLKPERAITDITKLKISLKSGYAHFFSKWYLIKT